MLGAARAHLANRALGCQRRRARGHGQGHGATADRPRSWCTSHHRARPALGTSFVAPRSDLEGAVAKIWENVLGIERIGVHDDFFELGGNSLLAVEMLSTLEVEVGTELPVKRCLECNTIAEVSEEIERTLSGLGARADDLASMLTPGASRAARLT